VNRANVCRSQCASVCPFVRQYSAVQIDGAATEKARDEQLVPV